MQSHFFVAGATGYTGSAVVRYLGEQGIGCTAHIRESSANLDVKKAKLESCGAAVVIAPWTAERIEELVQSCQPTHIISALGITKSGAKKELARLGTSPTYSSVDRDLSLMVYNAACALDKPPRFVFVSSMGADGAQNNYIRARHEVEQTILQGELPYLIARPAFLTGPDRSEKRPLELGAAYIMDGVLNGLSWIGLGKLRQNYASMTATTLGTSLVLHALHGQPNQILAPQHLRTPPRN